MGRRTARAPPDHAPAHDHERQHLLSLALVLSSALFQACRTQPASTAAPESASSSDARSEGLQTLGYTDAAPAKDDTLRGLGYIGGDEDDRILQAMGNAHAAYRDLDEGANADYIPVLAEVDSELFAIAVVTVDGQVHVVGDGEARFSIQSISKVFTMAQVMSQRGPEVIFDGVGVDATGRRSTRSSRSRSSRGTR